MEHGPSASGPDSQHNSKDYNSCRLAASGHHRSGFSDGIYRMYVHTHNVNPAPEKERKDCCKTDATDAAQVATFCYLHCQTKAKPQCGPGSLPRELQAHIKFDVCLHVVVS